MAYSFQLRMCFQDVDGEGIVYHSNYLDYAERARSEFLRDVGLPVNDLLERDVAFVIKKAEINYKSPARLEDLLTVHTSIGEIRGASMVMNQTIKRGDMDLVDIVLQAVFVNPKTMSPIRIPADLKEKFELYQGE